MVSKLTITGITLLVIALGTVSTIELAHAIGEGDVDSTESDGAVTRIFYDLTRESICTINDKIYVIGFGLTANVFYDIYLTRYPHNGNQNGEFAPNQMGHIVNDFPLVDATGFHINGLRVQTDQFGEFDTILIDPVPIPGSYNIMAHRVDGGNLYLTDHDSIDKLDRSGLDVERCSLWKDVSVQFSRDGLRVGSGVSGNPLDVVSSTYSMNHATGEHSLTIVHNAVTTAPITSISEISVWSKVVHINSDGEFTKRITWENPTPGVYSIILDMNNDGEFDPNVDIIYYGGDDGFTVYDKPPVLKCYPHCNVSLKTPAYKGANFGKVMATGDFNNDGTMDLVLSASGGKSKEEGKLFVVYGGSNDKDLSLNANYQILTIAGLKEALSFSYEFGFSLAVGDFNGDRIDDLAVGIPKYTIQPNKHQMGAVAIYYGSDVDRNDIHVYGQVLNAESYQLLHLDVADFVGGARAGDRFGYSLAAGDFNNDGIDDLAIGIPLKKVMGKTNAGMVSVIYGSHDHTMSKGLDAKTSQKWTQGIPGIKGVPEVGDRFGYSLAAGDFNGDGFDDLAIGVPDEGLHKKKKAGAVNVIYGGRGEDNSLSSKYDQIWHQGSPKIKGMVEDGDKFGYRLATGDFDGNGSDDLVIGVPFENVNVSKKKAKVDAGAVNVIYGEPHVGLNAEGNQIWIQGISKNGNLLAEGVFTTKGHLGYSLTVGDFDGDYIDDLAIGAPGEKVEKTDKKLEITGAAHVLYGHVNSGLISDDTEVWNQDMYYSIGTSEIGDSYGEFLLAVDFNKNGVYDLVVGIPGKDIGSKKSAGEINILHGERGGYAGLYTHHNHLLHLKP